MVSVTPAKYQRGDVQQPPLAGHPVKAVATSDANVSYINAQVGGVGLSGFQVVGCVDDSTLIADSREPRAGRPPLDVTLCEGSWE